MRLLYRGVSPPVGSRRTSFGEMVRKPSAGGPLTVMDPVLNEIRQEPHVQSVLSLHASPAVILLIRTLISAAIQERKKKKRVFHYHDTTAGNGRARTLIKDTCEGGRHDDQGTLPVSLGRCGLSDT